MLIPKAIAEGVRDGSVSTQYRRWDAPRVKVGGTQVTPAGVVRFTRVTKVLDIERGVELQPLKTDIRKLKALGLTISHDVGYELSPRGAAYLTWRTGG